MQRVQPSFRRLDSCGIGLGIQGSCFARITAGAVSSPFRQNQRIVGFCQCEARLGAAHLDSALKHKPRRTYIALPKQGIRTRHQPCSFRNLLGSGLNNSASRCRGCLLGDRIGSHSDVAGLSWPRRTGRQDV